MELNLCEKFGHWVSSSSRKKKKEQQQTGKQAAQPNIECYKEKRTTDQICKIKMGLEISCCYDVKW